MGNEAGNASKDDCVYRMRAVREGLMLRVVGIAAPGSDSDSLITLPLSSGSRHRVRPFNVFKQTHIINHFIFISLAVWTTY